MGEESLGFGRWFHTQLVLQNLAAGLVLGDGFGASAVAGQQAHGLAVRLLPPRLEGNLGVGTLEGWLPRPLRLVGLGELVQGGQLLLIQIFALNEQPLVERGRIGQG